MMPINKTLMFSPCDLSYDSKEKVSQCLLAVKVRQKITTIKITIFFLLPRPAFWTQKK
jgi:hypothetical protein